MIQKSVLHVIHVPYPPTIGGAELSAFSLMDRLQSFSYQLAAMLLSDVDESLMAKMLQEHGIPVVRCPEVRHLTESGRIRQTVSILKDFRPDLVHIHSHHFRASPYLPFLAHLAGIDKIIVTERTNHPREASLLGRARKKLLSRYIDATVAVSDAVRDTLLTLYNYSPQQVRVIRNAVDVGYITESVQSVNVTKMRDMLQLESNSVVIGAVANFLPSKGLVYLIQAMREVVKSVPNVHLLLVGDGLQRRKIERTIRDCGLNDDVTLVGWHADIIPFLATMDVFILPSLAEGFPRSVLEAMAAGLPVVATAVDGTVELIDNGLNGVLIPPADSGAISEALERLLLDRELAKKLGTEAQSFVQENFDLELLALAYRDIYAELGVD